MTVRIGEFIREEFLKVAEKIDDIAIPENAKIFCGAGR